MSLSVTQPPLRSTRTDSRPRLQTGVGVTRIAGRLVASGSDDFLHSFEDAAGDVSEVAERIVELSDGIRSVGDIVEVLCEEFEVDKQRCLADTLEFVKLLVERRILTLG